MSSIYTIAVPRRPGVAGAGSLPDEVWARFARDAWESRAVVLEDVLDGPLIGADDLLSALKSAAAKVRSGEGRAGFRIWIDGRIAEDPEPHLPDRADGTLEGYMARVADALGGREFTLLLADAHLHSDRVWTAVRQLLCGLYRHVGVPCGGVDTGVFLGRYRKTPFGVHRGQMSVMTFPVIGTKRFLLWPRGYGEAHADIQDSLDVDDHLGAAIDLEAGAHDILYWPADYWHIASGSNDFTAALNVGFWWDQPPISRVLHEAGRRLADLVDLEDSRQLTLPDTVAPDGALPKGFAAALEVTRRAVSGPELERAIRLAWLRWRSADGFRDIPGPGPPSPPPAPVAVELLPGCPVYHLPGEAGQCYVVANGYVADLPDTLAVRALLSALGRGDAASSRAAGSECESVERLFDFLIRSRAARPVAGMPAVRVADIPRGRHGEAQHVPVAADGPRR